MFSQVAAMSDLFDRPDTLVTSHFMTVLNLVEQGVESKLFSPSTTPVFFPQVTTMLDLVELRLLERSNTPILTRWATIRRPWYTPTAVPTRAYYFIWRSRIGSAKVSIGKLASKGIDVGGRQTW